MINQIDIGSLRIFQYQAQWKNAWDKLVASESNSALIHFRDYMEYHSDRYQDHSLICLQESRLFAVLPASLAGNRLISHQGLTFGGWIYNEQLTEDQLDILDQALLEYLHQTSLDSVLIKEIPDFFFPNTWKPRQKLSKFKFDSVIQKKHKNFYALSLPAEVKDRGKRWGARKAQKHGLIVERSNDWKRFWYEILLPNLWQRHNARPVHSLEEMSYLVSKFPQSIQLWIVAKNDRILGGAVIYLHHNIVHCQYLSSSPGGRELRAMDLLLVTLIKEFEKYSIFSFGTAISPKTGQEDPSLVSWKKSWGAKPFPTQVKTWKNYSKC